MAVISPVPGGRGRCCRRPRVVTPHRRGRRGDRRRCHVPRLTWSGRNRQGRGWVDGPQQVVDAAFQSLPVLDVAEVVAAVSVSPQVIGGNSSTRRMIPVIAVLLWHGSGTAAR